MQAAGAYAVGSFFIFLHLLERQAEAFGQLFLTHLQCHPARSDSTSDMHVGGVRRFLVHHGLGSINLLRFLDCFRAPDNPPCGYVASTELPPSPATRPAQILPVVLAKPSDNPNI